MYSNVLSSVRKAIGNINRQQRKKEDTDEFEWISELNPYKSDILKYSHIVKQSETSDSEKEDAIKRIGHNAYTGGQDASKCAGQLIPLLVKILKSKSTSSSLKIQTLMSLSEICHMNRDNVDMLRAHGGLVILSEIIGDTTNVKLSRWACYTLSIIMADNVPIMRAVKQLPNIWENIHHASEFPRPWTGWPKNIAEDLIAVLDMRTASMSTMQAPSSSPKLVKTLLASLKKTKHLDTTSESTVAGSEKANEAKITETVKVDKLTDE